MRISFVNGKYGFQFQVTVFNKNFVIRTFTSFNSTDTVGWRNRTKDGKYLIFLDYDGVLYKEHLIPELKYLQKKYKLSDLYIFRSSQKPKSYHVICLDKHNANEWMDIIEETSCDQNFKRVPIFVDNSAWVLRFFPKNKSKMPTLLSRMTSPYNTREKSQVHSKLLKYHYNIDTSKLKKLDNSKDGLTTTIYETLNYIKD